ncbi:hypothetical protein F5Y18DRAFT_416856 [Xylariaceae sp. FL1019]|nr:hypothetical protein F5Y18DRAFT_416856 [Xylariaceae sp. FL1019]
MAYNPVKRVVACVDGTWYDPNGLVTRREGNNSNIYRIYSSVKQGTFIHDQRAVKQVAYYETGVGLDKQHLDIFNDSINTSRDACDQQVNRIFSFCCQQLTEATDELWLFGFSRGAYVLRTVADLFHQLCNLGTWDEREYQQKVSELPAFRDRQRAQCAAKLFPYIIAKVWANQPVIHFLGLLDTIKIGRESTRPQPALLRSTQTLRHALALNETRKSFQPYLFGPLPALSPDLSHCSVIEAWFMGSHADIGGGAREDGLSLYPLQWMIMESQAQGLIFEPSWRSQSLTEEPLGLVFPANDADQDPSKTAQPVEPWLFQYTNGIHVQMVDLRPSHRHGNLQADKRKILQKRFSRRHTDKGYVSDGASIRSAAISHTMSEQIPPRKPSWRERFKLTKKTSRATLSIIPQKKQAEVDSLWSPQPEDELVEVGPRPHTVQINPGPALLSIFSGPRQVFDSRGLIGFLNDTPGGTIVHPSVYFINDIYDRLGLGGNMMQYAEGLDNFRQSRFAKHEVYGKVHMDPWRASLADLGGEELKNCRVLVCGRAGVGKSTLINKVFGSVVTQESSNDHGIHDVDEGFEMDTLPGLIVHDSRGFQSGATEEIELLERFVKKRAAAAQREDRLDAIWFCIDVPSTRVIHEADKKIFEILDKYARAVPVVIVRTMKDRFINEHYGASRDQLQDSGYTGDELDRRARAQAEEKFNVVKGDDIQQLEQKLGLEKDFAPFVYTSKRDTESIKELVKITIMLVPDDAARNNFVSAQTADIDAKINASIEESLRLLNYSNWSSIMGSMFFTSVFSTPTISHFLCARIIKCFGLSDAAKVNEIEKIAKNLLWKNMGSFVTQNFTQIVTMLGLGIGLTMATGIGGIPALASLPFATIPPAARLIAKCTCDLVLVLSAAFTRKGKFVTKQDFEESVQQYCAKREGVLGEKGGASSVRTLAHQEIDRLIPIHSVSKIYEPLSIVKMRSEFSRIVTKYRFTLDEEFVIPPGFDRQETDAGEEDLRGLDRWIGRTDYRTDSGTFFTEDTSSTAAATTVGVAPWQDLSNKPLPLPPQTVHNMKSMENVVYDAGYKAYHEAVAPVELPDVSAKEPWFGGASELPGSLHAWYPSRAELP